MGAVLANWKNWQDQDGLKEEIFEIGVVSTTVIDALRYHRDIIPQTALVTLSRSELAHLQRPSKQQRGAALNESDLDRLPEIINQPQAVLYDTKPKGKNTSHVLLYIFDAGDKKKGKVVVEVDYSARLKIGGKPLKTITSNSVRTAGYVDTHNLREPRYIVLDGEVEE